MNLEIKLYSNHYSAASAPLSFDPRLYTQSTKSGKNTVIEIRERNWNSYSKWRKRNIHHRHLLIQIIWWHWTQPTRLVKIIRALVDAAPPTTVKKIYTTFNIQIHMVVEKHWCYSLTENIRLTSQDCFENVFQNHSWMFCSCGEKRSPAVSSLFSLNNYCSLYLRKIYCQRKPSSYYWKIFTITNWNRSAKFCAFNKTSLTQELDISTT